MPRQNEIEEVRARLSAELLAGVETGGLVQVFECAAFQWNRDEARQWKGRNVPFGDGPFIKAPALWVELYIPREELFDSFGEYCFVLPPPTVSVPEMPAGAICIKGPRRIFRFKKLLASRGARFEVIQGEGPMPGADFWGGVKKKR
jgi:hypothetical protein